MKRLIALLLLACAPVAFAQEKKEDEYNSERRFQNKIFQVQYRDPNDLVSSIKLLGSGFKGAAMSLNRELRTITVRDFPENIATMEDALKRLDTPAPPERDAEIKISILIGSKSPLKEESVPEELGGVVKQLQKTLRYSHYGLMTASVQRTRTGRGIEGSGVAESLLLGMTAKEDRPVMYSYHAVGVTIGPSVIDVNNFSFSLRFPINVGGTGIQYQNVGFETPVTIRPNEKVVIGTTTMGDKAVIVVVNATLNAP